MVYWGWTPHIEIAFDKIEKYLKKVDLPSFKITYVKEKYGGFRTEYQCFDDYISNILEKLENKTHTVCEKCWCKGKERDWWWIYTLCDLCYKNE